MAKGKVYWLALALAFLILTGMRLLWTVALKPAEPARAVAGQLDLRDWKADSHETISLDGEWTFHPGQMLASSPADSASGQEGETADAPSPIDVPGSWNSFLNPSAPTPFGYGTYRLQLQLPSK